MRVEEDRSRLAARLRARRGEIEQAALARVRSVGDAGESRDPEYTQGLLAAVAAALDFGIDAVECGEGRPPPIPTTLLGQARLAARHGVKLDTVLRRYLAGYTLLGHFLIEESARGGALSGDSLKRLLRVQATLFDRLIAAVSEEYRRERPARFHSGDARTAERAERLLAGELGDLSDLGYELDGHHLGVVAVGRGAAEALRALGRTLDRRLLLVHREEGTLWAWLGGRCRVDVVRLADSEWPSGVSLAIGEPGQGISGWRLTHRQARAALPIARRGRQAVVRYADVALLATIVQDDLLTSSLHSLYLAPLARERDGGAALRETLRAYFETERNISSAAAALGISRQTVKRRLQAIEQYIGRSIGDCAVEIEATLRVERFVDPQGIDPPPSQSVHRERPGETH